MIVVTGASGRTGGRVTGSLVGKGKKVPAIGRDAKKLARLANLGAELSIGTVEDVHYLTTALEGAEAAYLVLPEDLSQSDLRAYQKRISDSYATAVADAK